MLLTLCWLYLVFSFGYGYRRALHSFPTRRSSDLDRDPDETDARDLDVEHAEPELPAEDVDRARKPREDARDRQDRKSTRLNSSHVEISYAVFCLKKKTKRACTDSSCP